MRAVTDILEESPAPGPGPIDPIPPHLRGWLHLICFVLSLPAGAFVVLTGDSGRARVAGLVYAMGMSAMFGVSAAYHRRQWSPPARRRMRRIDHGTIFVMIAGSYTPLCLLALRGATGTVVLTGVWIAAAAGFWLALSGIAEKAVVGLLCYFGMGWAAVLALPELSRQLSGGQIALLVIGGVVYTAGGIVLGTHWPNPSPTWFGYHEVWHTMVVVACAGHYVMILSVVRAAP
ncbi:MAG TPA: hemolysin III family protein [Acidimicrobiales bacterium]|nr:hemolysin III family protein [Acidimicrobiales bacterium]